MVENLGKELLLSGDVHGCHVRVSVDDTSALGRMKALVGDGEKRVYLRFADFINVFDSETKVNLVL